MPAPPPQNRGDFLHDSADHGRCGDAGSCWVQLGPSNTLVLWYVSNVAWRPKRPSPASDRDSVTRRAGIRAPPPEDPNVMLRRIPHIIFEKTFERWFLREASERLSGGWRPRRLVSSVNTS